jgi:hypothetical protein
MTGARPALVIPPDLRRALRGNPAARAVFEALSYTHRREHIDALLNAKKPETRVRRLEKTMAMLVSTRPSRSNAKSTRPATAKMGIPPGARVLVLGGDPAALALFASLPAGCTLVRRAREGSCEVVVLFALTAEVLHRRLPAAIAAMTSDGHLWVAYPKQSSGRATTLTRDLGWEPTTRAGLRPLNLISLNDTWSGEKFRHD